jgi:hypothetical protein
MGYQSASSLDLPFSTRSSPAASSWSNQSDNILSVRGLRSCFMYGKEARIRDRNSSLEGFGAKHGSEEPPWRDATASGNFHGEKCTYDISTLWAAGRALGRLHVGRHWQVVKICKKNV